MLVKPQVRPSTQLRPSTVKQSFTSWLPLSLHILLQQLPPSLLKLRSLNTTSTSKQQLDSTTKQGIVTVVM